MVPYIIIIIGAALSFMAARYVFDFYQGAITGTAILGLLTFQFVLASIVLIGSTLDSNARGLGVAVVFLLFWLPGTMVTAVLVMDYIGFTIISQMFFPHVDKPVKNKLGAMKSLLWDEDVPGAVKACLDQFEQYPDEYDILLDGAALLCERGSYLEALNLLQKTSSIFHEDKTAWSQATYQAATIRMEQLDDKENACALFRRIAERMPDSEVGMRARERMHGDKPTVKPPEGGQWISNKQTHQREESEASNEADPFYRKRSAKLPENNGAPDIPKSTKPSFEDEMRGMFLDDDTCIR